MKILLILSFAILLIILTILIIYYIKKRKRKNIQKQKLLSQILQEKEKLILNTLKKTGKIKSSYLRKQTQLPKATFSRHIQELEKKELIKRSGLGRNKFIESLD